MLGSIFWAAEKEVELHLHVTCIPQNNQMFLCDVYTMGAYHLECV